jgi:hypothetical protein
LAYTDFIEEIPDIFFGDDGDTMTPGEAAAFFFTLGLIGLSSFWFTSADAAVTLHPTLVPSGTMPAAYPDPGSSSPGYNQENLPADSPDLRPIIVQPKTCPAQPESFGAPGSTITIAITSPEEDDIIFYDVVPYYLTVSGTVDAEQGIRSVILTNGKTDEKYGKSLCATDPGTHYDLACEILIADHITVSVTDAAGNNASVTRNIRRGVRPPGPGDIWVTGVITDDKGNAIPCASITFNRQGPDANRTVTTTSKADGSYSMKKASGSTQVITVRKDGYRTIVREATFRNYNNELNFTLVPGQGTKTAAGFGGPFACLAVSIGLLAYGSRRGRA